MNPALRDSLILTWIKDVFPREQIEREWRFHSKRRFRLDFAVPRLKIAIEYQGHGGGGSAGGHGSLLGMAKDAEKFNLLAADGWTLVLITRFHLQHKDREHRKLTPISDILRDIRGPTLI